MVDLFVKLQQLSTFLNDLKTVFVRKVPGKELSDNNYTTEEKNKLAGISDNANKYELPKATTSILGGIKVGNNIQVNDGVISVDLSGKVDKSNGKQLSDNNYTSAEKDKLAGIEANANNYKLPKATTDTLGGVKVGANVQVNDGVISVDLSGKVDKVPGKQLSDNNFTDEEKEKLTGVDQTYLKLTGGTVTGQTTFSGKLIASGETSVPTPAKENDSDTIASTKFVHAVVNALVDNAPEALDTLNELSKALGNDPNFSTTILTKIGEKESKTDANIEYTNIRKEMDEKQKNIVAGNVESATKLKDARTITVNLGSTTGASFNGTANVTPGVSGTLPVANGGTGATSLDNVTVGTAKTLTGNDGFFEYLHRFGNNASFVDNFTTAIGKGVFSSFYTQNNVFKNQPSTYGQLINIPASSNEVTQIWIEQISGRIWSRGCNSNYKLEDMPFVRVADTKDLSTKVDKETGKGLSTNDYTTAEKTKLAGIESNANKYILPVATNSILGGVKVGTGLNINNGVVSVDTSNAYVQPNKDMGSFVGKTVAELKSAIIKETYVQGNLLSSKNLLFREIDFPSIDFSNNDAVLKQGPTYTTVVLQNCTPGLTYGTILIATYSSPAYYVINVWNSKWSNPAPILTSKSVSTSGLTGKFTDLLNRPTTLSGYGITDAKIENGVVTLGNNSIKPITTIPTASASTLGGVKVGSNLSIVNGVLSALAASQTVAGYMSAADKKKLDGIATGANAYSLPTASASILGGVKVGEGINVIDGSISIDIDYIKEHLK